MQSLMSKSEMQAILDLSLDLVQVQKEEEFNAIFDSMSNFIPFKKAALIHISRHDFQATGNHPGSLKIISNNIHQNKKNELLSPDYLINNKELAIALKHSAPFWLHHPEECDFGLLGTNNLVASFSTANASENTVLTLDCSDTESSDLFPEIIRYVLPNLHEAIKRSPSTLASALSSREYDVLNWLKEGKTTWDISQILSISERTVKFHIHNICRKLNANNRTHALAKAIQLRLIN